MSAARGVVYRFFGEFWGRDFDAIEDDIEDFTCNV
jgi:hypothetical protein